MNKKRKLLRSPRGILECALKYAAAGYKVLPVRRNKTPLVPRGAYSATTDEATIKQWWRRWPDANVAIALEGFVVVDVDPQNGGDDTEFADRLPQTCMSRTGRGGSHRLYRIDSNAKFPGHLAKGIDIKSGAGAYIVAPPSIHENGVQYTWESGTEPWRTEPRPAPSLLVQPKTTQRKSTIDRGRRNTDLTSVAGVLRRIGADEQVLNDILSVANERLCDVPLDSDEVRAIAASIARYEPAVKTADWDTPLDLASLAKTKPSEPALVMHGVPCGYVTGVFGHGGVGKSQIELMRAVCIAMGLPFCGWSVQQKRVMYLSCEDRQDVLHWRLSHVCSYLGIDMSDLRGKLYIFDLVGRDSTLFAASEKERITAAYDILAQRVRESSVEVLFVDSIADAFDGNENSRSEVKRFMNAVLALMPPSGAVVLVGHVNKASAVSGATREGYSGSTAWNNSVRARWHLYAETEEAESGRAEPTGRLILELQKSNLGTFGDRVELEWDDAAKLHVGHVVPGVTVKQVSARDEEERRSIIAALQICAQENIKVPAARTGSHTAFQVLSQYALKMPPKRFWRHLNHLRDNGAVHLDRYRRANRHWGRSLVLGRPHQDADEDG